LPIFQILSRIRSETNTSAGLFEGDDKNQGAGTSNDESPNDQIRQLVIPTKRSEVENGAAGEAATCTGKPDAERSGSERIKPREGTKGNATGSFDFSRACGIRLG
jgi:hypothetical protein